MATTTTTSTITAGGYTDENIRALEDRLNRANESLQNYNTNAATDEELRRRAESEYNPSFNAQVQQQEDAKNTAASTLNNALTALGNQYNRDAETIGRQYDQQRVNANNTMLARGLNNSSLAAAFLNQVDTERNRALQNLQTERTASETAAQNAYNDAITAADAAIGRLNADRETAIDARYQALREAEQNRVNQAIAAQNDITQYLNSLMLQIEQLRQQGYSQYLQQQQYEDDMAFQREQWEYQKAQNEKSSGGGSGGSGSGGSSGTAAGTAASAAGGSLADLFNSGNQAFNTKGAVGTLKNAAGALGNAAGTTKSYLEKLKDKVTPSGVSSGAKKAANVTTGRLIADLLKTTGKAVNRR